MWFTAMFAAGVFNADHTYATSLLPQKTVGEFRTWLA